METLCYKDDIHDLPLQRPGAWDLHHFTGPLKAWFFAPEAPSHGTGSQPLEGGDIDDMKE